MVGLWIVVFNWAFLVVSVGAIGVGVRLTRGRVRLLLALALGVFLLQLLLGRVSIADGAETTMLVYSGIQGLLSLGLTGLFVAAAVTGSREARSSQATIAALADETHATLARPEGSPDPRLLAD